MCPLVSTIHYVDEHNACVYLLFYYYYRFEQIFILFSVYSSEYGVLNFINYNSTFDCCCCCRRWFFALLKANRSILLLYCTGCKFGTLWTLFVLWSNCPLPIEINYHRNEPQTKTTHTHTRSHVLDEKLYSHKHNNRTELNVRMEQHTAHLTTL